MKWLISWSCTDRGRHRRGKGILSISDSASHSHFSLCLASFWVQEKSYSGKTVNQSPQYHDSVAARVFFSLPRQLLKEFNLLLTMTLVFLFFFALCLLQGLKEVWCRRGENTRTYSVVWTGDHGVRHPGAKPWPWCAHCDGITYAGQLPTACGSERRREGRGRQTYSGM